MTSTTSSVDRADISQRIELNYYSGEGDPMGFLNLIDDLRASHNYYWSTFAQGFWVLTDMDGIREALQHPEIFSNTACRPDRSRPAVRLDPGDARSPRPHEVAPELSRPFFAPGRMADAGGPRPAALRRAHRGPGRPGPVRPAPRLRRPLSHHDLPRAHGPPRRGARSLHGVGGRHPQHPGRARPRPRHRDRGHERHVWTTSSGVVAERRKEPRDDLVLAWP